ncbi:MAG: HDIG domain-containing metalloprotein [Trueperaceae bacterium]
MSLTALLVRLPGIGRWLRSRRTAPLRPWPTIDAFGPRPEGGVVVGGAVRDALLGQEPRDVDWLVHDPEGAARSLADRLGGSAFPVDPVRGHWRVVRAPSDNRPATLDLAPLRGALEDDLAGRDFTIDAMAIGPHGPVDPLGGRRDLQERRLVQASRHALTDDPLRGLRGLRLAAELDLTWEQASWDRAASVARDLQSGRVPLPAAERRRDELVRVVASARPGDALTKAHRLGWLELLLPELLEGDGAPQGGLHHLDVMRHQLEALQRLASAFPEADLALRLATLLHDVGKPRCRAQEPGDRVRFSGHAEVGARIARARLAHLRFERAVRDRAAELVRRHMLPLPKGDREARRFVHRRRALLPDLLKLMIADREAARGPASSDAGRRSYRLALARVVAQLAEEPSGRRDPWLDGRDVMELLGLEPGPRVGEAVRFLAEATAVGDVRDRDQAISALRRYARAQGWPVDDRR